MVGWTVNLHGNTAGDHRQVDAQIAAVFADEFEQKLHGPVDLSTFDWIWDQYEKLAEGGKRYSDKFRPTRPANLAEAGEGCFGIPVK
ncbi:MAG: hypothetical protein LC104_07035 [Bacteroidales bacterium]|nr:hypothetical protein [Bacteroidales bacterium]